MIIISGTRPQVIKALWLKSRLLEHGYSDVEVWHLAQHYDSNMIEHGLSELLDKYIPLGSMRGETAEAEVVSRVRCALSTTLGAESQSISYPAIVIGDCSTTLGALFALTDYLIPVIHLEAGTRCSESIVEGIIRTVVDHSSSVNLAPTKNALNNLIFEGGSESTNHFVGDISLDRWLSYRDGDLKFSNAKKFFGDINITMHRSQTVDNPTVFRTFIEQIIELSRMTGAAINFFVHPRMRGDALLGMFDDYDNIHLHDPVPYDDMWHIIYNSDLVITDSGGAQREAFWGGTPCVIVRGDTEWPEIVEYDNVILSPVDMLCTDIVENWQQLHTKGDINLEQRWETFGGHKVVDNIIESLQSHNLLG